MYEILEGDYKDGYTAPNAVLKPAIKSIISIIWSLSKLLV